MSNYTAPVEDMGFVLKEVVEIEKLCNETGLDGSTVEILDTVLEAAGKLAKEEIEPINKPGDSEGLKIDVIYNTRHELDAAVNMAICG